MAKIKTPTTTPATEVEPPTVDISILVDALAAPLATVQEAEQKGKSGILEAVIAIIEFRDENPSVERSDVKTAVQQAVANMLSLKIAKVQNSKANGGDDYAYTLASQMLNTAWPKGEKEQAKVKKAIEAGKGWVEVRRASSKPQTRPARDPDANKITRGNFVIKLNLFLTQAQADMAIPLKEILDLADEAIAAIAKAPPTA